MPRKKVAYFVWLVITLFLLLFSEVNSTSQIKLKENKSTTISKENSKYAVPLSSPLYDTGGYTYYDLQALDRLQREIAIDTFGNVHAVWMKGLDSNSSDPDGQRGIYYSSWSANGTRLAHEVQVSELGARGGFPSITVIPDGRAVCVYHHANTLIGGRTDGLYASVEQTPGLGDFTGEIHLPDSVDGMGDAALWPSCAAQNVDDSAVIHVVGIEGPNASGHGDFIYTRGVESPQDTFTFSPAQRPDSSDVISIIVVASRKSNKVAIVYSRQKSFSGIAEDADIFYIESTDGGRDWVNGFGNDIRDTIVNVTNYQPADPVRASGDLSAVYDEDDSLHIVWIAPLYSLGATASECYIYHWSKTTGIDQVADGTFNIPDVNLPTSVSNTNLRNPHIGVHDGTGSLYRKNYLYVTWSQFGPHTSDHSNNGFLNGEIYVNASTNRGQTWGYPINITNSQTPACDRNCDSDVYPSLAERVNDTLHVLYVNDKSAGTIIYGEGDPVLNPVLYYKYPAYVIPCDFFSLSISPPIFEDVLVMPGAISDSSFKIPSDPCLQQDIKVDSIRTKGSSWLTIKTSPDSFTLKPGDPPKTVDIRFDATALSPSTYIDTILVYSSVIPFRSAVPIRLIVTDCGYFRRSQVMATVGDLRVKFSNTSNLADQDPLNGFYLTGANLNFLFDGSTVLTTITADGDTIAAQDIAYNRSFKPLSTIDTQTVNLTDSLTYYQALLLQRPAKAGTWLRIGPIYKAMFFPDLKSPDIPWPGPWFGYQLSETWWIKVTAKPRYVLWFTKIFKADPPCWWSIWPGELVVNNIYAGSVLDWDVPSDSEVINTGAYTDTFTLIYQNGRGVPYNLYYAGIAALVDTAIHLRDSTVYNPDWLFGAHILSFAKYVTGGFEDSSLYQWFSKPGVKHDFVPYEDISSILTSIRFDTTKDTVRYVQALAVSSLGYDSLKQSVFRAQLDMRIPMFGPDCFIRACDVDGYGTWNLADIVALVNIVFKGAVKPTPLCRTDCNGSGGNPTLTDIIYLVNKVFKGGPNPIKISVCCK